MDSIVPVLLATAEKSYVRFVHQGGGLERMEPSLFAHVTDGEAVQLRIDGSQQRILGGVVSAYRLSQKGGYLPGAVGHPLMSADYATALRLAPSGGD
jgi:hypothetical protein